MRGLYTKSLLCYMHLHLNAQMSSPSRKEAGRISHICKSVRMRLRIHAFARARAHAHAHTHTHTYTHAHAHVFVLVLVLYMHVHSNKKCKLLLRKLIKTLNRPKALSQYISLVVFVFFRTLSLAMIRVNKVSSSSSLSHFPPCLPLMMVHIYFN